MTTQVSVETLSTITYKQIPVITTELLAHLYGTEAIRIRQNHHENKGRFIEEKHFFKLEGETLREFKHRVAFNYSVKIARNVRSLILWTERGAARHAKMLETDQAWEVFEKLEDCYFSQGKTAPTEQQPQIQPQFTAEEIILLCYMQLWMEKAQDLSKHLYPIMKELNSSYTNKLYDIAFETIYMVTKNRDALLREVTRLDMSSSIIQRAMPMLKSLRARQFEF
ncbi:ORF6N domain-containing protein [Escherichia coli]|uniref:Putative antirepressor protein Ant from prophage n=3 Tax=Escherichia coli TaxID=562 RepID=A0A0E0Y0E8_ECO1C|nr:ORF6N domain-containing protein [Escherichia coli]EFX5473264.1 ORF6N domain-containing protein [Shigella sonnei]EGR71377.1 putative antirepressor protein Ant from prophage [Escherichia coli O104:H4 str. LB226692]EHQ5580853.1 ORF6N domain-containing protein [Escherichia coli O2]EYE15216.1 P22AR C-terminal domain protein [Escherichia coli 1-110-08_S3_C3]EYE29772.1 P22AR C-terminal domain protein [Escherichia coli 1-110-08_S3_C2]EYE30484.1 P22AR C-terminal domain protein [Escherichia coli 1-1